MKNNKILSSVLAIAAVIGLAGCSNNSGITPAPSDNSTSSVASGSFESTSDASTTNTPDISNGSTSTTSSNDPIPETKFVMPTIEKLSEALPVEYKGDDIAPVAGSPDAPAPESAYSVMTSVAKNIETADSVIMTGELDGEIKNIESDERDALVPITQKYVYVITKNATYLRLGHEQKVGEDGTTNFSALYEEYKVLNEDGTVTTITKDESGKWVGTKTIEVPVWNRNTYKYTTTKITEKLDAFLDEEQYNLRHKCQGSYRERTRSGYSPSRGDPDLDYLYQGSNLYDNAILKFGPLNPFDSKIQYCANPSSSWDTYDLHYIAKRSENGFITLRDVYDDPIKKEKSYVNGGDIFQKSYVNSDIFRFFPITPEDRIRIDYPEVTWETSSRNWKDFKYGDASYASSRDYNIDDNNVLVGLFGEDNVTLADKTHLKYNFTFSNWNNIKEIFVPEYELVD